MRLLIHQALKDLRIVRWLALAWLLLVAGFQAFGVWLTHVPMTTDSAVPTYAATLGVAVALFAVIAVVIVQNDPAVGTTAFWFTRPVSLAVLLGSKFALAIVLLVLVPIAADLIAMVAGGIALSDALATVPLSLLTALVWLLPLLAVAAITLNLAQFMFAVVIELLVFAGGSFALHGVFPGPVRWADARSMDTLTLLLVAGLVTLGLASLLYAYRVRTLRRAATLTGLAPVALVILVLGWPWPWSFSFVGPPPFPLAADVAPGSLTLQPENYGTLRPGTEWEYRLIGEMRFSSARPGQTISPAGVRGWIEYPDERVDLWTSLSRPGELDLRNSGFIARVPRDAYVRHRTDSGVLHLDVAVTVYEQQESALAVRVGEEYRQPGRRGRIVAVSSGPDALSIDVQQNWIRPEIITRSPNAQNSVACVVRNRGLGITVTPSKLRGSIVLPETQPPVPVPAHLAGNRITFTFPWPENVTSDAWLRGAEFVVFDTRTVGDAVVHATVPNFVLSALKQPAPPR